MDDFEDWRKHVRLQLQARSEWQVIYEVSDGAEAVQMAEKLKPDFDLARHWLANTKWNRRRPAEITTFAQFQNHLLAADNSLDIVQEVWSTSVQGYAYKAHAQSELLPAIEAVLQGKQFLTKFLRNLQYPYSSKCQL